MSRPKLKTDFEVMDYLKKHKAHYHNLSARKVAEQIHALFDARYSDYRIRKMMIASGVAVNTHKPKGPSKVSLTTQNQSSDPTQLDRMEKKLDFVCDFIQYAKTGEVPQ